MIYSIGGLIFSSIGGTGFKSFNRSYKGEYTEQKLVDGAMSVKSGRPLDKFTWTAQWLGMDKQSHINDLLKLVKGSHQASDQDGLNLGVWTVDSITVNSEDVFAGAPVCHNVTISLSEYR